MEPIYSDFYGFSGGGGGALTISLNNYDRRVILNILSGGFYVNFRIGGMPSGSFYAFNGMGLNLMTGGQNGRALPVTGQTKVYIETNGIGHVYIVVNRTVFSYNRYDGSYTPQSGRFGPVGNGILYKYEGEEAETFIKQRMEESPTNVYSVDINISGSYNILNDIYNQGTVRIDENRRVKFGRHIDTYFLIGNNCTTITSEALRHGDLPIGNYQTPASMNKFFYDSNVINNGYNPDLWCPKR